MFLEAVEHLRRNLPTSNTRSGTLTASTLGKGMKMSDEITSGGLRYETVRVHGQVSRSYKTGEVVAKLQLPDEPEPLIFFMDESMVDRVPDLGQEIGSLITVILLERQNGNVVVEVPGEPASFGPKIVVPSSLLG